MQILIIKNQNFQTPSRKPSNRTKLKILKKKCFWTAHKKNGENRRKSSEIFFKNLRREGFDLGQKKFKIISCLCTFKLTLPFSPRLSFFLIPMYSEPNEF